MVFALLKHLCVKITKGCVKSAKSCFKSATIAFERRFLWEKGLLPSVQCATATGDGGEAFFLYAAFHLGDFQFAIHALHGVVDGIDAFLFGRAPIGSGELLLVASVARCGGR